MATPGRKGLTVSTSPLPQVEQAFPSRRIRLVVACRAGTRSTPACEQLADAGYRRIRNMRAGFDGWVAAGLPVESGPLQRGSAAGPGSLQLEGAWSEAA